MNIAIIYILICSLLALPTYAINPNLYRNNCNINFSKLANLSEQDRSLYFSLQDVDVNRVAGFSMDQLMNSLRSENSIEQIESAISRIGDSYKFISLKMSKNQGFLLEGRLREQNETLIEMLNDKTKSVCEILEKKSIPHHIAERPSRGGGSPHKIIVFDPDPANGTKSFSLVSRYQKAFDTNIVTADFYENIMLGSHGFSLMSQKRIDIGIRGLADLLKYDKATGVVKHEFAHAAFVNQRKKLIPSIYLSEYRALTDHPLGESGYSHYMSTEELYTFSNEPFWGAFTFEDISRYQIGDILLDLKRVQDKLSELKKIGEQTYDLSREFINEIKSLKESLISKKEFFDLGFLNKNLVITKSADDLYSVVMNNTKNRIELKVFLDKDKIIIAKRAMDLRNNIMKAMDKDLDKVSWYNFKGKKKNKIIQQKYNEQLLEQVGPYYIELLNLIEKDQAILQKVAGNAAFSSMEVKDHLGKLFSSFNKAQLSKGSDVVRDPYWVNEFKDMRKKLRELGVKSRPQHKNFPRN